MQTVEQALAKLAKNHFRAKFHLTAADRLYIQEKGWNVVEKHAREMISRRLAPAHPAKDGRQTPWRGHPVFIAQHACACCCRRCLYKWYKVPLNQPLTQAQQEKIFTLLMAWLHREMADTQAANKPPIGKGG